LVDLVGQVKAREGDRVEVGGGFGPDDIFHACGEITAEPPLQVRTSPGVPSWA
jgi:hypothetical protein